MTIKTKAKNTPKNYKKSLSRLMAIQIFYQIDFANESREIQDIKNDVIENYVLDSDKDLSSYRNKIDESFLDNLISGLSLDVEKIDIEISALLKGDWTLEKLDDVTLQILRFSALELRLFTDIPAKVVMGEYVDIAASFFDDKKVTFINAALDTLAKKFRSNEFTIDNQNDSKND